MSNEYDQMNQPSNQALDLYLQENDADRLTDILVDALFDALRILNDDVLCETLH